MRFLLVLSLCACAHMSSVAPPPSPLEVEVRDACRTAVREQAKGYSPAVVEKYASVSCTCAVRRLKTSVYWPRIQAAEKATPNDAKAGETIGGEYLASAQGRADLTACSREGAAASGVTVR